jgi:hypothetical protein
MNVIERFKEQLLTIFVNKTVLLQVCITVSLKHML